MISVGNESANQDLDLTSRENPDPLRPLCEYKIPQNNRNFIHLCSDFENSDSTGSAALHQYHASLMLFITD